MEMRDAFLREFEAAYLRMVEARTGNDAQQVRHAERNFYACAEGLAKRVPMLIESDGDWPKSA